MSTVISESGMQVRDHRSAVNEPAAQPMVTVPDGMTQETALLHVITRAAQDKTLDLDRVERLFAMQEKLAAKRAESEFLDALARFKESAPVVSKDMTNNQYNSRYASLGNTVNTTNPALGRAGLTASWELDQTQGIKVTCVLSHVGGHSKRVSLSGPPDSSGAKNPIQQIKSTVTYLELATFQAVTGIATHGASVDDDGNSGVKLVTEEQIANLEALITEVGANRAKFLKLGKVERVGDLRADQYPTAVQWLQNLRSGK